MRFFVVLTVCLLVFLQISFSYQTPAMHRRVRQADGLDFPDEETEGEADVGERLGWGDQRRRRPGSQNPWLRPGNNQGGNRPGNNQGENPWGNIQGGNGNQQLNRPTTTTPAPAQPGPTQATQAPTPSPTCIQNCGVTPEFNPVCGSNRQSYTNRGRLDCAAECGVGVSFLRMGYC